MKTALSISLCMFLLVVVAKAGYPIPVIQPVFGFFFLFILPGSIFLKCLNISELGFATRLPLVIAISIAITMLDGLFMNIFIRWCGIDRPFSEIPMTISIIVVVIILSIIATIRYKGNLLLRDLIPQLTLDKWFLYSAFILIVLPIIAIIGAHQATYSGRTTVLIALLITISGISVILFLKRNIPERVYPMAILGISLALLLHEIMFTNYLLGGDILTEYILGKMTIEQGYWDSSIEHLYNSSLAVTMLGPIISFITGISILWVLKLIYPLLFATVPLALYAVYRYRFQPKVALSGVLLFMFWNSFYETYPTLGRQEIALIGFAALLLLLDRVEILYLKKLTIGVLGLTVLIFGHYGTSYILLILLGTMWLLTQLAHGQIKNAKFPKFIIGILQSTRRAFNNQSTKPVVTGGFLLIFISGLLGWYMYTASGAPFEGLVSTSSNMVNEMKNMFQASAHEEQVSTSIGIGWRSLNAWALCFRLLWLITHMFVALGTVIFIFDITLLNRKPEYIALSGSAIIFLGIIISLPYFSSYLGAERIYPIAMMVVAPFFLLGIETFMKGIAKYNKRFIYYVKHKMERISLTQSLSKYENAYPNNTYVFASIILSIFLLFSSGFIREIAGNPDKIPLSRVLGNYKFDNYYFVPEEVKTISWMKSVLPEPQEMDGMLMSDAIGEEQLHTNWMPYMKTLTINYETLQQLNNNSLMIYLRSTNVIDGYLRIRGQQGATRADIDIDLNSDDPIAKAIRINNVIYSTGHTEILQLP